MKAIKLSVLAALTAGMLFSGCSSMTNTGKGALIGAGGGGALGAAIGGIIGGGKGAAIGAAIGGGVGAGAGALIGKRMDKQAAELQKELADKATVETVQDANGLQAIKVTFSSGILFPTNGTTVSENAKQELIQFAQSLQNNPNTDVKIYGFTDDTGTMAVNQRVATGRADSVLSFLANCGIAPSRLSAQGIPMADYVAPNTTAEGRAMNRRVEIYITADKTMIQQAENGQLS